MAREKQGGCLCDRLLYCPNCGLVYAAGAVKGYSGTRCSAPGCESADDWSPDDLRPLRELCKEDSDGEESE